MPPSPALAAEGLETSDDPFSSPPSRIGLAESDAAGEEQLALADEAPELEPVFAPRPTRTPGGRGVAPKPRRLPPRGLLRRSSGPTAQPEELIARTSRLLEETLGHFGIEATVSDTVSGPRVTRYELQLAPGTKVGRITALRDDLAYALAAREELRIIAPIPGQAGRGRGGSEPRGVPGDAGRHHARVPGPRRPADGLARARPRREAGLHRPGPDAPPADRRLHRHRARASA